MSERILSLGASYFEITSLNFPIGDAVAIETETVGSEYVVDPGGSAINFVLVCAKLELEPSFIGKIGNDSLGQELLRMLDENGVKPDFTKSSEVQTNIAINYVRPDGKTLMFVSGSANQSLEAHEVEEKIVENLPKVNFLYLGGVFKLKNLMPVYGDIIKRAKDAGVKVVIDHGRLNPGINNEEKEIVKNAVELADYYFPSRDELIELWGGESIEEAIKNVRTKAIIVVKDGENGAYGFNGNEIVHVQSFTVETKNTVGAGDSFNAGFLKAQIDGLDLHESLRFACATAALKISKSDLPTVDEVKKLCQMS